MAHPPTSPGQESKSSYLAAEAFFARHSAEALTYDDVSLATNYSEILPRDARLVTRLSQGLELQLPIISADMDTVTESEMAIGMALNGGLGLIHYNLSEKQQVKEVIRVKNHINGLIQEPITFGPDQLIGDVMELVDERNFKFRTFPIVDEKGILVGLLPSTVVRPRYAAKSIREAMMPRRSILTIREDQLGNNPVAAADFFFSEHLGIHKLLVVDKDDKLRGLFTLSDIERITEENTSRTRAARDSQFRLVCGAAIAAARTATGELDKARILDHVGHLVDEGLDAVAVSTAHGHTRGVGDSVRMIRDAFPDLTVIAGNVTSAEGVEFLADCGADAVKVGQGPGSICTTRIVAGVGIPQLTALHVASQAKTKKPVRIIADGGINKSGDIVKALTLADAVICGGMLAGCREAPGKIIEINGKLYKQYRGMGSHEAMKAGSAARYGHEKKDLNRKAAAEGVEALKEISGSLDDTLAQLAGGVQSGMGYLGAADLAQLKSKARYVRVTSAGQREAAPHDIIEIKTTKD
ncbi:MAG: IMP dehydrogenase [Candidatus Methylacidiphilales bacterium]|nr:IMP dehydrogenase [Candidatus Methylacidiphilales bacterium]